MPVIYRKYGKIAQIVSYEKTPTAVRVSVTARVRSDVIRPRRVDSLRRTKTICLRRMLSAFEEFGSPLLVTLTFAGIATDVAFSARAIGRFQMRVRRLYPKAACLFIPELSPAGRIHWHGLIFNVPLSFGDRWGGGRVLSYGTERTSRFFAGLWGYGFVDIRATDGNIRLAYYLTKYITKSFGETLFNGIRLIRLTNGFPREIVIKGSFAEVLKSRFDKKAPFQEYFSDNPFLGAMRISYYELSPD